jgi:hypothetical protein
MGRFATSIWFPLFLGLLLLVTTVALPDGSWIEGMCLCSATFVLGDGALWIKAALASPPAFEVKEPKIDWWDVAKGAYDAPAFFLRLVVIAGLSTLGAAGREPNGVLFWVAVILAVAGYVTFTLLSFRNDIVSYMKQRGARLKSSPIVNAAGFDTRNPDERR